MGLCIVPCVVIAAIRNGWTLGRPVSHIYYSLNRKFKYGHTSYFYAHIYIDYTALITRIQQWKFCGPSCKLLLVSMKLATYLNKDLIPHHVKSYQDDECEYDQLLLQA